MEFFDDENISSYLNNSNNDDSGASWPDGLGLGVQPTPPGTQSRFRSLFVFAPGLVLITAI